MLACPPGIQNTEVTEAPAACRGAEGHTPRPQFASLLGPLTAGSASCAHCCRCLATVTRVSRHSPLAAWYFSTGASRAGLTFLAQRASFSFTAHRPGGHATNVRNTSLPPSSCQDRVSGTTAAQTGHHQANAADAHFWMLRSPRAYYPLCSVRRWLGGESLFLVPRSAWQA
ncbi:hypothetical protein NDU88_004443 [Pleurodeles waltl]|uniref:Uncharacterized protein n=1 Tax=Pleurodeles waltl TaxID=8319 RepID=A0AAV7LIK4_PLEWA|nr:hypothetical protein NDU88_004443 [Pleurodeles waltl]